MLAAKTGNVSVARTVLAELPEIRVDAKLV